MLGDPWDPRSGVPGQPNLGPRGFSTNTPFPGVNGNGNMFGSMAGTIASSALPGAGLIGGAIGTGLDVHGANNELERLGLGRNVAFGRSFGYDALPFGLGGRQNSTRSQFENQVTKAYPGLLQAMTPRPTQAATPAWEGTPSMGFFDSINDLGTVGNLGATLDAKGVPGGYQGAETGAGNATGGVGDNTPGGVSSGGGSGFEWRHGGPVGNDGDNRLEPVQGTLHEDEFVMSPEAVDMVGMKNMEMMNSMAQSRGSAVKAAMIEMLKSGKMGE